jgi:adenylate kinase family enzyme
MIESEMKRIFVTGNAGSGKSTLGKEIARRKNLEYYSLDAVVWKEKWQKSPPKEQKQKIAQLTLGNAWVIDGVDYDILKAADTVIFLDMPRRVCFYRAAKRNRKYFFSSRPELPAGCLEILIIPTLVKIIWRFPQRVRPKILADKARRNDGSFIHIKTSDQLKTYLDSL